MKFTVYFKKKKKFKVTYQSKDTQGWQKGDYSSFAGLSFILAQVPEPESYMSSFEIRMLLFLNVLSKQQSL